MTERGSSAATVLVVEDDTDIREALAEILREEGYEAPVAMHGDKALEYLRAHEPPALILLDLMMPVKNGWQFRAEQQQDPSLADIPVVLLSGDPEIAHHARLLKADGYLAKPVEMWALLRIIAGYCERVSD